MKECKRKTFTWEDLFKITTEVFKNCICKKHSKSFCGSCREMIAPGFYPMFPGLKTRYCVRCLEEESFHTGNPLNCDWCYV